MIDIKERLVILLSHWIEHNHEHENEFLDWADREGLLSEEVAKQLRVAAAKLAAAGDDLVKAQKALIVEMEESKDVSC